MDAIEKIDKLKDKIKHLDWIQHLDKFLSSATFEDIVERAIKMVQNGRRFTPEMSYWFRAFEVVEMKDVKVVILGQDPYPQLGVADGIAFSSSRKSNIPSSLDFIFDALEREYGEVNKDPDLTRWCKQGVLMLNCALTTEVNKVGSHYHLWYKFIGYILHTLATTKEDVLFVFMGTEAGYFKKFIHNKDFIKAMHPNVARYRGGVWEHDNLFSKINNWLASKNLEPIAWN